VSGLLLDTCAVLWIAQGQGLSAAGKQRLASALEQAEPLLVSTISAWEIGMLVSRGRVSLTSDTVDWLDRFMQSTGAQWTSPTPDVMVRSSFLPGDLHGDPVDRILVASARDAGAVLFTGDKGLLDYGSAGHVRVHKC
jgi:PIN domain nuclease of toxin-antitoxin system